MDTPTFGFDRRGEELPFHVVLMANRARANRSADPQLYILDGFSTAEEALDYARAFQKHYEGKFAGRSPALSIVQSDCCTPFAFLADEGRHGNADARDDAKYLLKLQYNKALRQSEAGRDRRRNLDMLDEKAASGAERARVKKAALAHDLALMRDRKQKRYLGASVMHKQAEHMQAHGAEEFCAVRDRFAELASGILGRRQRKDGGAAEDDKGAGAGDGGTDAAAAGSLGEVRLCQGTNAVPSHAFRLPDAIMAPRHAERMFATISTIVCHGGADLPPATEDGGLEANDCLVWIHGYHATVEEARAFARDVIGARMPSLTMRVDIVKTNTKLNLFDMHNPSVLKRVEHDYGDAEIEQAAKRVGTRRDMESVAKRAAILGQS